MKSVLSFDIATTTGWAYAPKPVVSLWPETPMHARRPAERKRAFPVKHGSMKFEGSNGRIMQEFMGWLDKKIRTYKPNLIAIEAPLQIKQAFVVQRRLLGMYGILHAVARNHGLKVEEYTVSEVKQMWCHHGSASKGMMIQEAIDRGFSKPKDDNAADAIAVLNVCAQEQNGRWSRTYGEVA